MSHLVGFGDFGEIPGVPASLTPVTQEDLERRLAEERKAYTRGALLIGGGVLLLGVAAAMFLKGH